MGLQEGVHVLPTVEVTDTADLSVHDGLGGVTSAVAEDEALDVGGLDLAAVVYDVASWVDHDLSGVQTGEIDL